jgi:hypothetical protein
MASIPNDKELYEKTKKEIYKKYPVHSAYRSGLLVKAYKEAYEKKHKSKNAYSGKKKKDKGLSRWYSEDLKNDKGGVGYTSKSSVYRPTKRITKDTPTTFSELTKEQIEKAKKEKARTKRVKQFSKL